MFYFTIPISDVPVYFAYFTVFSQTLKKVFFSLQVFCDGLQLNTSIQVMGAISLAMEQEKTAAHGVAEALMAQALEETYHFHLL